MSSLRGNLKGEFLLVKIFFCHLGFIPEVKRKSVTDSSGGSCSTVPDALLPLI